MEESTSQMLEKQIARLALKASTSPLLHTLTHVMPSAQDCSPWRNCYEGYVQTAEPTLTSQRKCQRCTTGYFVTNSPPNPTECIEWQDCSIGEYEAVEGANYEDRTCAPCSPGSFSTTINQEQLNLGTIAKQGHTLQCRAQHLPIELVQLVLVESTRQAKTLKSA
eukprot:m.314166 g.314166  ORF g.314166 m.314166 type:complete len:165 (+) comp15970_c0_seq4:294-788(+)